ncbi:MAG TPA: helix-turn-helix domain-containing protein [Weissella thailandensis]|jgi:putative zinc finger/helix-turn-helix YgiT family protein|uniref:XRE family transcriptional regulator n=1 Tax=Lactobacillus gallinarum DSM 10532 = JCM 2011 TaxID=1423748 RepID=A0A0R1P5N5_9LACO|nr:MULTISPECIES: type II TA system antitoxin MqsA family protein [Lactobacillaceae]KRL23752.1 XRE family transcriptional regulator [Lactobacillus gallinarum DSM 10532 = JCM 2011]MBL1059751.1 type II toxin-antitoxin system MqsA family antitoxin [Lactobacillus sp. A27]HJG85049.1 helix-turn-helix domain-containing protein [Weissella thailandensis]
MNETYVKNHTNTFEIKGENIEITTPARFDSKTNKIIDDMELDNQAVKMAQEKYRKKYNYVGPKDIKALRQKWNLTQKQLANIIGWSPSTIALYEVGEIPTKSNNRLLKVLIKDPQAMKDFITESEEQEEL